MHIKSVHISHSALPVHAGLKAGCSAHGNVEPHSRGCCMPEREKKARICNILKGLLIQIQDTHMMGFKTHKKTRQDLNILETPQDADHKGHPPASALCFNNPLRATCII